MLHARTSRSGTAGSSCGCAWSPPASSTHPPARRASGSATQRVGAFTVVDGRGSRLLAPMRAGTHTLTVVYRGGPLETAGRTTVTVTVP